MADRNRKPKSAVAGNEGSKPDGNATGFESDTGATGNNASEAGSAGSEQGLANGTGATGGNTGDNGGNATGPTGSATDAGTFPGTAAPKRRGRPPKLDADGNRVNQSKSAPKASAQLGVSKFVPNDRKKAMDNIQSLHGFAAIITKQPVFALTPEECASMSSAICDVADYHEINLFGGFGPYGLYANLAVVLYMVYAPRMATLAMKKAKPVTAPPPIETVGGAANNPEAFAEMVGTMDFSNDLAN